MSQRFYNENDEQIFDVGDNGGIPQWNETPPPNQTSGNPIYPHIVPVEGTNPLPIVDATGEPFEPKPNVTGGPTGVSNPRRTLNVFDVGGENVYSATGATQPQAQSQPPSLGTLFLIGLGLWLIFGDKK